jgi:predicted outer membrane repeat protein
MVHVSEGHAATDHATNRCASVESRVLSHCIRRLEHMVPHVMVHSAPGLAAARGAGDSATDTGGAIASTALVLDTIILWVRAAGPAEILFDREEVWAVNACDDVSRRAAPHTAQHAHNTEHHLKATATNVMNATCHSHDVLALCYDSTRNPIADALRNAYVLGR